jgi:hypothetical protein
MKDIIQFIALCVIVGAITVAVPVAGFIIGGGLALWFLWGCFKEERNVHRN